MVKISKSVVVTGVAPSFSDTFIKHKWAKFQKLWHVQRHAFALNCSRYPLSELMNPRLRWWMLSNSLSRLIVSRQHADSHFLSLIWSFNRHQSATSDHRGSAKNCALFEENMKLLPLLDDTIRFIFRCGGQSERNPEAKERSNSKSLPPRALFNTGQICRFLRPWQLVMFDGFDKFLTSSYFPQEYVNLKKTATQNSS